MARRAQQHLTESDVAALWARERAQAAGGDPDAAEPIAGATVRRYVNAALTGRYAGDDNPFPLPRKQYSRMEEVPASAGDARVMREVWDDDAPGYVGGRTKVRMVWYPEPGENIAGLERRLVAWWHNRPGQGVGGGRPRRVSCPCGCGTEVAPGQVCEQETGRRRLAGDQS